jgi:hypothetical protein
MGGTSGTDCIIIEICIVEWIGEVTYELTERDRVEGWTFDGWKR